MIRPLLFLLVIISTECIAQDSLLYQSFIPRHAVKISPFHLLSFYPTIQLAYEVKIAKRLSFQIEGGYVINYKVNVDPEYQNKRGGKGKLELHYYMLPSTRAQLIFYGAAELYYNAVDFDRRVTREECFNTDCNQRITRQYTTKVMYREPGIGLKMGFVKYFSDFFIDINSGWAIRFISYTESENIRNFFNNDNMRWLNIPNEEDRVALAPIIGIRLGYRLK